MITDNQELLIEAIAVSVWGPVLVLALIWRLTVSVKHFNRSRRRKAMLKAAGRIK